jgi:isopenicillin-N epimerase
MSETATTATPARTSATFGRARLQDWLLDPAITHLNHGTQGATPRRVLEAQRRIQDGIERQPAQHMLRELSAVAVGMPRTEPPRLRTAAAKVASFLGAKGEDLVFVDNITSATNAVFRSLELREGDEILITDLVYGALANAAAYVAGRAGARVVTAATPYPIPDPGVMRDAILAAVTPRTRLVLVEHIASESAILLPVAEIVEGCRAKGARVLVDGAHVPGAIPLDIPSIGADWYGANLHKWAQAPRSCGILWATPARQAETHPTVISWGLGRGFTTEFDWAGTHDPSAYLSAPEGIAFLNEHGFDRVRAWIHDLAWEGARYLAKRWGTELGVPESMIATMATLPVPSSLGSTPEQAASLRDALLFEDRIEVQVHAWRGRIWARISAQIYNEMADMERLADAVRKRA